MEPGNLLDLLPEEIEERLDPLRVPRYRARQIFRWIHKHGATRFTEMTDLPPKLREWLAARFRIDLPQVMRQSSSTADRSQKFLYRLQDGEEVETVQIATGDGPTACVSSQAGCRYDCAFCATALGGFMRSLQAGEIAGQVLALPEKARRIVYMGMGEPLANYKNVVRSIRLLTHPDGLALAPRRITLSTVGLAPLIDRLRQERLGVRLAISLASAIDEKRRRLTPISKKHPLAVLLESARRFALTSGTDVTFEYPILSGINDSKEDARALVSRLSPLRCKVNLIPFNPVAGLPYSPPPEDRIDRFLSTLAPHLAVTVRRSAGREIDAACGQLRLRGTREA